MSLFDFMGQQEMARRAPLASRMRPHTLDEVVGQEALTGPKGLLRRALSARRLPSLVLYGPPGSGKTTIARLLADLSGSGFAPLSAVTAGVADLRKLVEEARQRLAHEGRGTVVFVDEIHRWNRAQQDALLPHVEDGLLTLVGATTENPLVALQSALVSRLELVELQPLGPEDLGRLLDRALADTERGLGSFQLEIDSAARAHLIRLAGGDARVLLNHLELAAALAGAEGKGRIELGHAEQAVRRQVLRYDSEGDQHYHTISAFIKSVRGSDPDAAIYWLARMIEGGEDPLFIARRLVILASEDVGNADPLALTVAAAALEAVRFVGLPEARIPLAQATIYLALAPKSNASYLAINRALEHVRREPAPPVPVHLRDPGYGAGARFGHGREYRYPHDHPGAWVPQSYLPETLAGTRFVELADRGGERSMRERLERLRRGMAPDGPA